jgi:hypothetical protein
MATVNGTSTTNNINWVLYSYGTALQFNTDRKGTSLALHASIVRIEGLGMGVTVNYGLFTVKTS